MRKYIFNWLRRITLRQLGGYVSDEDDATKDISTQRMDLRFTRKKRTTSKPIKE